MSLHCGQSASAPPQKTYALNILAFESHIERRAIINYSNFPTRAEEPVAHKESLQQGMSELNGRRTGVHLNITKTLMLETNGVW